MKNDSLAIFAFRGTYWTEWPFANYAFTNLTMKCSQTNTPAHKNEDDEFQRQKWRRNFSKDLSRETAVCECSCDRRLEKKCS